MTTMRDNSRSNWTGSGTLEDIKLGSLQRIADATEAMAKNHISLQEAHAREQRWRQEGEVREAKLQRRVAALRGVITRMQRKGRA